MLFIFLVMAVMNQAVWLAKRVMSQVEYNYRAGKYDEMEFEAKSPVPFEDFEEYSYELSIQPWKIPFIKMLMGASGGEGESAGEGGEDDSEGGGGELSQFEKFADQVLGKDPFKIAHVEVSWAEGAQRDSITLTYLLTNLAKLSDSIGVLKGTYDGFIKKENGTDKKPTKSPTPTTPTTPTTPVEEG